MDYINIYILLYKVKNYPKKWIIKFSDNYRELKDIIRYVDSNENKNGNYFIIRRVDKASLLNDKFKQFQIFTPHPNDELIYMTI